MKNPRPLLTRHKQRARSLGAAIALISAANPGVVNSSPAGLLAAAPAVLSPAEASAKDNFGAAVAIDGTRMAVGATGVDKPKDGAGSVYLYERDAAEWQYEASLQLDNDIGVQTSLGAALALEGNWLAAGAPGVYAGEGAVFLYSVDDAGWLQRHRFLMPGSQKFTAFGGNLDMHNGRLIAGAPGFDGAANDTGVAMLYELTDGGEWVASAQLQSDSPGEGERFGSAVALHGNLALVGAHGSSAAYLFQRRDDRWEQVARFSEEVGEVRGNFGDSVALVGDTLLIGAPFADTEDGERRGSVFIYTRENGAWNLKTTLYSDTPNRGDEFGRRVVLQNGLAVIASPRDDTDARDAGAVLVFDENGGDWTFAGRLSRSGPASYDEFGRSLAADAGVAGGTVLVGTPSDAPPGQEAYSGTVSAYPW